MTHSEPEAEPQGAAPPIAEFLAHAYMRRRGATFIFLITTAATLLLAALIPNHYRAMASLAIVPSPEFTVREDAGSRAINNTAFAMDQIMKAETEILESDDLHEGTISDLGSNDGIRDHTAVASAGLNGIVALYPDLIADHDPNWITALAVRAANWSLRPWRGIRMEGPDARMYTALQRFSSHLRVTPTKDGNVIDVAFEHESPLLSAKTLNAMLARYATRRERLYNDPQFAVAEHETELAANMMGEANAALTTFKTERGLSDLPEERELFLKRRSQADQALADATSGLAQAEARQLVLNSQISNVPRANGLFEEIDTDTKVKSLDDSLVDLRGRLAAALPHYRETSHVILDLRRQIYSRQIERSNTVKDPAPSVKRAGRSPVLDPLVLDRAHALADMEAAKAAAISARTEISRLDAELEKLNSSDTRLSELTRKKLAADERFASASRASGEQKLTEAEDERRLANVRIIQPARVPQRPTSAKLLILLGGFVFGSITAWFYVLLKYLAGTTYLTPAGLAHATQLPVLAVFTTGPSERQLIDV